jgi:DNA-binding Xre family transcriptional regulator
MLYLNIKRVSILRNVPSVLQYLIKNGFSTAIANRIAKNADSNIKFKYLEKLCILFHCTPNDLIQWQPDADNSIPNNEPITTLNHPQTTELTDYLKTASIEELTQMHQKIITKPA